MTTHDLKIWPEFFGPVRDGSKTFEIRDASDRDFQVGDVLVLREYDPRIGQFTGEAVTKNVSHVMRHIHFPSAVPPGHEILSFAAELPAAVLQALRFYASGSHFNVEEDKFDTVSGEPSNWQCHEEESTMFEDGAIARIALTQGQLFWEEGSEPDPIAGEKFSAAAEKTAEKSTPSESGE